MHSSPPTIVDLIPSQQQPQAPQENIECRICLEESLPLIIACSCTGTVKYVHEECLKHWAIEVIKKKIKEQEDEGLEEVIESIECELCKQNIPLKVEWTDKRLTFEEAKLRNEEYFWSMFGINMFIVLVCVGCILFTMATIIMVLIRSPRVDYQKFIDEPLLSWGTLSVALASGIIFLVKAVKDLYGMFVKREFQIEGVISKHKIEAPKNCFNQDFEFRLGNIKSISDFKVNVEGSDSDRNRRLSAKSKRVVPALEIEPETNQDIIVPSSSMAGLKHFESLPPLRKFVQNC